MRAALSKMIEPAQCVQYAAMEASMDGMAIHDNTGAFTYLNEAHANIYGYDSKDELLGKTWHVLYEPQELARFNTEIMPILWTVGAWRGEAAGLKKNGTTFPQEVSLTTFGDDGLICVVRDISAQKQIERSLKDTAAAMHTFVSIASHELKTPLTVFQSYVDLLNRTVERLAPQLGKCEDFQKLTHAAKSACGRMRSCIDTLLDTARINEGRLALNLERVDFTELVTNQLEEFNLQGQLDSPTITSTFEPAFLMCDHIQISHLVTNLISNAVKYGAGQPIEIVVRARPGKVTLIVQDHGIGISDDNLARIFGRFERAVTASKFEGSGLGLWLVAQIASAHAGTIRVESNPEHGTAFTVDFPSADPAL